MQIVLKLAVPCAYHAAKVVVMMDASKKKVTGPTANAPSSLAAAAYHNSSFYTNSVV